MEYFDWSDPFEHIRKCVARLEALAAGPELPAMHRELYRLREYAALMQSEIDQHQRNQKAHP